MQPGRETGFNNTETRELFLDDLTTDNLSEGMLHVEESKNEKEAEQTKEEIDD